MKMRRIMSAGLVCMLAMSLVVGCGSKKEETETKTEEKTEDTSWNAIEEAGTLKIGLCPEYPPFESVNDAGDIEVFDADLAAAIAEEMGVEVEFANTPWEGLISGLNNGDFDMIMSAMSPEEATAATDAVNLSDAYYELGDVIAVKVDNDTITKKEDLEGKTIGFQTGSGAEQCADKLDGMGIKVAAKNPYNRTQDALAELENGRIDAVLVSYPYAVTQSKVDKAFKVVNDPIDTCDLVAISVKGSDELTKKYNEALKTVKDSGKYAEIEVKWLTVEE